VPFLGGDVKSFEFRNDTSYKQNVGELILRLARVTPQGMLVFFASFAQMDGFIRHWKGEAQEPGSDGQLWAQMEKQKWVDRVEI
jgi:Rad3-related DNA helicase